jgi:riboflavin biosynthesis pyrimidine reductase
VFANFVATLDGLVSFALPGRSRADLISLDHPADRFMLALLRACADAVIVGAGTLREYPRARWGPEETAPDLASDLAALRASLAKPRHPLVVFVTASGKVDLALPVFTSGDPVLIVTTREGATRLGPTPSGVRVHATERTPKAREIVDVVAHQTGGRLLLTEGGPTVLGQFLRERMLDELFLTLAPQLAGRSREERRLALVEGVAFDPDRAPRAELLSVRRADDHLFFRYRLRR